jgi:hypothetical protein
MKQKITIVFFFQVLVVYYHWFLHKLYVQKTIPNNLLAGNVVKGKGVCGAAREFFGVLKITVHKGTCCLSFLFQL